VQLALAGSLPKPGVVVPDVLQKRKGPEGQHGFRLESNATADKWLRIDAYKVAHKAPYFSVVSSESFLARYSSIN
jgi:hypothetical protein